MSKFAIYSTMGGEVSQWINTDDEQMPEIVPENELSVKELTDDEWDARVNPSWVYEGVLTTEQPPLPIEWVLDAQKAILLQLNQLAAAQKAALTNRIGVINDAIEFEEATPAEVAELPVRQAQLTAWKRYAVLLGRVTTQEGWPPNVIWPEQPAGGMDLTISAARPSQALS